MEQIIHIYKVWSDDGWYMKRLSDVNDALSDGWRVKMLSSYGTGSDSMYSDLGAFVVLENDD